MFHHYRKLDYNTFCFCYHSLFKNGSIVTEMMIWDFLVLYLRVLL